MRLDHLLSKENQFRKDLIECRTQSYVKMHSIILGRSYQSSNILRVKSYCLVSRVQELNLKECMQNLNLILETEDTLTKTKSSYSQGFTHLKLSSQLHLENCIGSKSNVIRVIRAVT